MKKLLVIMSVALVCEVKAVDLSTAVSAAKTLYGGIMGLIGTTTVTAASALGYWRLNSSGTYNTISYNNNWTINRNPTTGAFFYSFTYSSTPGSSGSSTDPFDVESLPSRRNYHCDLSSHNADGTVTPYIYNVLETFYAHVWTVSVVHTGYFSPQPPYPVWLKSYCTTLPSGCGAITPSTREIRNGTQLYDSGTASVTFNLIDYEYSWPALTYVGGIYDN